MFQFTNSRVNSNFKNVNPYKLSGFREGIFSEFILGCLDTVQCHKFPLIFGRELKPNCFKPDYMRPKRLFQQVTIHDIKVQ